MKIHIGFEQQSIQWLTAKAGVVSASEIDALVSPKWEVRKGKGVDTYIAQKVAESWIGGPIPTSSTLSMEFGNILEQEVYDGLAFEFGWKISRPAFITTDDSICGCSPDGMCDDFGIEIKNPGALNHTKYLLAGVVPDDYIGQCQFSMWVTGMKRWKFVSNRRGFPQLVLDVERDETAMNAFSEAVAGFKKRFDASIAKLIALNGGEPPKRNSYRDSILHPQPENIESFDYLA